MNFFIVRGHPVFREVADASPVDFILDYNNKLLKIQVKTLQPCGPSNIYKVRLTKDARGRKFKYTSKMIDIVAVYLLDINKICFFKMSDFEGKPSFTIRNNPTKNNQSQFVRFADEHADFDRCLVS